MNKPKSTADILADIRKKTLVATCESSHITSEFADLVNQELKDARAAHPAPFHSAHEGLAILQEEFEELKQEVYVKHRVDARVQEELIQLAAMCRRFYEDLYGEK